jgi:hypothetical protein
MRLIIFLCLINSSNSSFVLILHVPSLPFVGPKILKQLHSPTVLLVQFSGRLLISVLGSKIENKFLIIFSLFY